MSEQEEDKKLQDEADAVIKNLRSKIDTFEEYVARRFDEVSMEINATSQLVGMAEEGMGERFGDMLNVLGAISYDGDGTSPANTGVELEAVIKATEEAANNILDAADSIMEDLQKETDWTNEEARKTLLGNIETQVQNILMSCTFQDLTGQRINKTLDNLKTVETQLAETLGALGIDISESSKASPAPQIEKATSQDDIDNLFS